MEHELDGIFESFSETDTPVKNEPEKVVEEVTKEPQEDDKPSEQADDTEDNTPFPKKAVNAISRRDKIIAKERAEKAAMAAELERFRSTSQAQPQKQSVSNDSPKEDDFETYGEFLEAKVLHKIKTEQAADAKATQDKQVSQQEQMWQAQREQEIVTKVNAHKDSVPDFANVIEANADIADEFPPHIERAFLEADDAAMAFYNLAKDGKLEALLTMSPYKAMMEIAKAQEPRQSLKRVSNAPQPISSASGKGNSSKSVNDMTGEELLKKFGIS